MNDSWIDYINLLAGAFYLLFLFISLKEAFINNLFHFEKESDIKELVNRLQKYHPTYDGKEKIIIDELRKICFRIKYL